MPTDNFEHPEPPERGKPEPDSFGQIGPEQVEPGDPETVEEVPPSQHRMDPEPSPEPSFDQYNSLLHDETHSFDYDHSELHITPPTPNPNFELPRLSEMMKDTSWFDELRRERPAVEFLDLHTINPDRMHKLILSTYAGMGAGPSRKPTPEEPETPVEQPDPYPSRAGWRAAFLGEYEPTMKTKVEEPKVKIGDYEAVESDVSFEDVGGNERAKGILMEVAEQFADPDVHSKWDDPIPKGVLLYGNPGTGKTMVAKAFAKEAEAVFIAVPVAKLRDAYYGETEKNLTDLFTQAGKHDGPVVIFFDEIDSLLPDRTGVPPSHPDSQMVNAFLQAMDGMKSAKNVMVLGATNYPESLDAAAIRPGRFDRKIKVELPDKAACGEILARRLLTAERKVGRPLVEDTLDLEKLSGYLEGMSGAEIAGVVDRTKNTMARTERAMKKSSNVAEAGVDFDKSDIGNLLITADDIIPAIVNYRTNG